MFPITLSFLYLGIIINYARVLYLLETLKNLDFLSKRKVVIFVDHVDRNLFGTMVLGDYRIDDGQVQVSDLVRVSLIMVP